MMTLTGFLLARIAEDEAAQVALSVNLDCEVPESAHWSTTRVLAECEAKRRTITEVLGWIAGDDWREGCCHKADVISQGGVCRTFGTAPDLLRPMAAVYSDHPDYQQKWAL